MAESTDWTCTCGATSFTVRDVPASGAHIVCYCEDCRAFARLRGAEDALDEAGGTQLFQTAPEVVTLLRGAEHLRCLRLTPRGPLRWYADCCGAPVANTAPRRGIPFLSMMGAGFAGDRLGRPVARIFRQSATGRVPRPYGSLVAMVAGVGRRVLTSRLSGGWKSTPFFAEDGAPLSPPTEPAPEARRAAYSRLP
ncbi:hypothetical protein LX81_01936 [Palleronia aestuarii]|uniref:CENP-V/GFA domain-containing protein n=1 Tax=Palleronia aestuarii TaxID=568105 RepID=A0A2W7N822_9RHOB|nr:DUF6151 family protein [Palleronia aestuarii]PZX16565.1 hypothetical protein LX81_01936 [Palleronia aestuarii]